MNDARRYVVIGGGLAGLAAAVWLAEAGKPVTLLERRARLGGRTQAMEVPEVGDIPDNGQHVVASGSRSLFRYLESVGTREHLEFPGAGTLRWPGGRAVLLYPKGFRAVRTLLGAHPDAGMLDRLRALRATIRLGRQATKSAMEALIGGTGVIDEVFDRQRMHGRTPDGAWLYCLTTSGAYEQIHKSNDEIVEEQLALIRRYCPEAEAARLVHAQVVKMPKATFSQVLGTTGLRPDQRTSVPNLVLAGDWTRTDWSATMESAAQSAERAVAALLEHAGAAGRGRR